MQGWLYSDNRMVVRPFAVVELYLQEWRSSPPHTEDRIIDTRHCRVSGILDVEQQVEMLESLLDPNVADIFGAQLHTGPGWYVNAGEGRRSLGTIRTQRIWDVQFNQRDAGTWDYRLTFSDLGGQRYRLAVTDLAFRSFLDARVAHDHKSAQEASRDLTRTLQRANVYLRIGLARGWEKYPDRCYLQITGVYSFPDYLSGRCFADFPPFSASAR